MTSKVMGISENITFKELRRHSRRSKLRLRYWAREVAGTGLQSHLDSGLDAMRQQNLLSGLQTSASCPAFADFPFIAERMSAWRAVPSLMTKCGTVGIAAGAPGQGLLTEEVLPQEVRLVVAAHSKENSNPRNGKGGTQRREFNVLG